MITSKIPHQSTQRLGVQWCIRCALVESSLRPAFLLMSMVKPIQNVTMHGSLLQFTLDYKVVVCSAVHDMRIGEAIMIATQSASPS